MALKLARYATGRHKTISMWDSFHGASLDAISIGGEQVRQGQAARAVLHPLLVAVAAAGAKAHARLLAQPLQVAEQRRALLAGQLGLTALALEPAVRRPRRAP